MGEEESLGESCFSQCFFRSIRKCLQHDQRTQDQHVTEREPGTKRHVQCEPNLLPDFLGSKPSPLALLLLVVMSPCHWGHARGRGAIPCLTQTPTQVCSVTFRRVRGCGAEVALAGRGGGHTDQPRLSSVGIEPPTPNILEIWLWEESTHARAKQNVPFFSNVFF